MHHVRIISLGAVAAAAAGLFPGCQVDKQIAASCSTSPPIPHHNNGVVFVSADVPAQVDAGTTFVVTVDVMGADAGPEGGESLHHGTLEVTGGVTPSGNFVVGQGPFGGPAFPVDLEFTATGQPGDTITITAVGGSGVIGQLPNASIATCTPLGDASIANIPIVAPPQLQDSVTGSGTAQLEVGGVTAFEFDVQSGPAGQEPTGEASLAALFASAPVTCLDVRTLGIGATPFDEATMNLLTAELGLVTLQVSDGNPEGLPDFISAVTHSQRSPQDCSRIVFGSETVKGFVETGDIDMVNADA